MQGARDSRKESCAMQRAAKVKDGKIIGKREKYKNTTQDHGRRNSSGGQAKISGQSQGKILFEEEVIKLPKVWQLTPSIQGLCWTSVTRHVNSLWSSYMLWGSLASGQVQQVVSAGGSRFGTDIMEDLKNPKPSGMECDAPTKGAEGCENTVGTNGGGGTRRSRCRSKESRSSDTAHSFPTNVRICTVESCVDSVNVLQILIFCYTRCV